MDAKTIRHTIVDADYMDWYPGNLEYRVTSHSRGNGKNSVKESVKLVELRPGAFDEYLAYLREVSVPNYSLVMIHAAYAGLRDEIAEGNDPEDLREFKEFVRSEAMNSGIPMKYVRQYLSLTMDDIRDPNTGAMKKWVKMTPMPIEY